MAQSKNISNSEAKSKRFFKTFSLSSDIKQQHCTNKPTPPETEVVIVGKGEVKATNSFKDESKFSDYIRKVKNKMRCASNVGRNVSARESFNDKVSDYINRAKIKIRTTTLDKDVSLK